MTSHLVELGFAAEDPLHLAGFWSRLLRRETDEDGLVLTPTGPGDLAIRFVPSRGPRTGRHQIHLHLTSTTAADQDATVARALALGGRHLDVGQLPEEGHVVLADPEGNELCVIEPGNAYLDGCGFLGELAGDGSVAVGRFWSEALGWPLVWDQDEETAIQSPAGGTKIAWGGPPMAQRTGPNRMWFHLAADGDADAEAARLVALGASRPTGGAPDDVLLDPDGNPFRLVRPGTSAAPAGPAR